MAIKACLGPCHQGAAIDKEEIDYDASCAPYPWQVPHRVMKFQCTPEYCYNGTNWDRSSWTIEGDCTADATYDNTCPTSTCRD